MRFAPKMRVDKQLREAALQHYRQAPAGAKAHQGEIIDEQARS